MYAKKANDVRHIIPGIMLSIKNKDMIIDFHTHTFPDKIASVTVEKLGSVSNVRAHTDGSMSGLSKSMRSAGIDISIIVPVATNVRQVAKINDSAAEINRDLLRKGIFSFGGIHPDTENYKEELNRIKSLNLRGIKLHPNYQDCYIDDIRYKRIIDYANSIGLIVIVHAGIDIGLVEPVYGSPDRIASVIDEVQPDRFVLAHMGGWRMWDEVEEYIIGKDVYLDTAFCLGPIDRKNPENCPPDEILMEESRFIDIVKKHGEDKILFGTDSPWCDQKTAVSTFAGYPLSIEQKQKIYYKNAAKLLKMSL